VRIGVPIESKDHEFRVGLVPDGVRALRKAGHEVIVARGAGLGSGFCDEDYRLAGAALVDREEAWSAPDLVVKVKEPNSEEASWLHSGQVLFTYLHLAAAAELTEQLRNADVIAIAYETIRTADGAFPVLAPMSEVAGRLATQVGAHLLQKEQGGKGLLLGGVPGVMRGRVTVLGAGTVGLNALRVAHALGAEVDVLDLDLKRLTYIYDLFRGELNTLYSNPANIERSVRSSDLVIGAVYTIGRRTPTLVDESLVASMEAGSVLVDVAVDQGGCIETVRPTTHSDPTYVLHDVIHYGVANMPGAYPRTSTQALTSVTLPYVQTLVLNGLAGAMKHHPELRGGINCQAGRLTCEEVATAHGLSWAPPSFEE